MKPALRGLRAAAASAALLVLAATPGAAEPTAEVTALSAQASSTGISVTGKATFAGHAVVVGEDAPGDATQKGIGADISGATIQLAPNGRDLIFTFAIADQPPAPVTAGMTINYNWGIAVDGNETGLFLSSGRAGLDGISPSAEPFFNVSQNGEDGFSHVASVTGKMAGGVVQWTVPMAVIGAKPGSAIGSGYGDVQPGSHAGVPGVVTYYNNFGGDAIAVADYTLPGAVQLGIAPVGTPDDQIATTTAASLKSAGTFSQNLPLPAEPGTYTVLARACATAEVCSTRTTTVSF